MDVRRLFLLAAAAGAAFWLAGCQSTGSIGHNTGGTRPGGAAKTAASHMPTGQQVSPPYGYVAFCLRNRAECEGGTDAPREARLTPARWAELNDINDDVNRKVRQIEDSENYGAVEYWAYPNSRGGDCEDFALLKRRTLIERGWPAESLLLTVVRERNGDGHAVLTIATDKGDYILDNKIRTILAWNEAPYKWVKRQSTRRPYIWVTLDPSRFEVAARESVPPLGSPLPYAAAKPAGSNQALKTANPLRPSLADESGAPASPHGGKKPAPPSA